MTDATELERVLSASTVEADVFALIPDYRALLVIADGVVPAEGDENSEALLRAAESAARQAMRTQPVDQLPHVASWREAYRAFGAKPQRTRNSVEALMRRAESGLPRVNRLTDLYNAISVLHQLPVGGEDLNRYVGAPRLKRAVGNEPFETTANGDDVVEHPDAGEVVWTDAFGVTCRRWNWRQSTRTQLRGDTTAALFILDAIDPMTDRALHAAADDLTRELRRLGPNVQIAQRLLAGRPTIERGE